MADTSMSIQQSVAVNIEPATTDVAADNDEYEMTDDDGDVYITALEFIDLNDILRQEAILQLPLKRLCSENCKGIDTTDDETENMPLKGLAALKKLKGD
jgi:uncharacterized protein